MGIRAYCPLHAQQPEQERQPVVPTASLVYETLRAEDVRCGVHLMAGCHAKENDNDDYIGLELAVDNGTKRVRLLKVAPRLMKTKEAVNLARYLVPRQFC